MKRVFDKCLTIDDRHLSIVPSNFYVAVRFLYHQSIRARFLRGWVAAQERGPSWFVCNQITDLHITLISLTTIYADEVIMPIVDKATKTISDFLTSTFTYYLQGTFIIRYYSAIHQVCAD